MKPYPISRATKKVFAVTAAAAAMVVFFFFFMGAKTKGSVQLVFNITQNKEMILFSEFGEPPQFAIWLEEVKTGKLKTVFVTYRTAANDWVGKTDCLVSLPLWDSLFKEDSCRYAPDSFEKSSYYAVTGATPQEGRFQIRANVDWGSAWICWVEVNLAGDFNNEYRYFDRTTGTMDTHHVGQPGLIYRAAVTADPGKQFIPQVYGMSVYSSKRNEILRPVKGITTASNIFETVTIQVVSDP